MIRSHRLRSLSTTVLLASVAAIALPVQADPVQRPFKSTLKTQEILGFNPVACPTAPFLQGTTTGTGEASLLGRVSIRATDCVVPGDTTFTFTGGKFVLTAANGDTVTAEYSGSLTPSGDLTPSALSGRFRVTGGTGRFTGATGSGFLVGSELLQTGEGTYTASGTLTY